MNSISAILTPYHILVFWIIDLILIGTALFVILKTEKGLIKTSWILLTIFLPIIGPVIYLIIHSSKNKRV